MENAMNHICHAALIEIYLFSFFFFLSITLTREHD